MKIGVVQHDSAVNPTDHRCCGNKQAIVGTNEDAFTASDFECDHAPLRCDTGVDDGNDNATWDVLNCARQHQ